MKLRNHGRFPPDGMSVQSISTSPPKASPHRCPRVQSWMLNEINSWAIQRLMENPEFPIRRMRMLDLARERAGTDPQPFGLEDCELDEADDEYDFRMGEPI